MKRMNRITAGALLISLLLTSFASCSESEQNADETKSNSPSSDVSASSDANGEEETKNYLDATFGGMSVDFGWIHTGDAGMGWFVNNCLNSKLENITSYYNRMKTRAEKHYNNIVEFYRAID